MPLPTPPSPIEEDSSTRLVEPLVVDGSSRRRNRRWFVVEGNDHHQTNRHGNTATIAEPPSLTDPTHEYDNNDDDDNNNVDDNDDDLDNFLWLSLLGRPYASRFHFWWQHVPSSIVLGICMGTLTRALVWSSTAVRTALLNTVSRMTEGSRSERDLKVVDQTVAASSSPSFSWMWLLWTVGGSLLASLILEVLLLLPGATSYHSATSLLHSIVGFHRSTMTTMTTTASHTEPSLPPWYVMLFHTISGWIVLACGAPVGVDRVVLDLAGTVTVFWVQAFRVVDRRDDDDQRINSLYLQAVTAAAIGTLLPSPLLALLLLEELGNAVTGMTTATAALRQGSFAVDLTIWDGRKSHDMWERLTVSGVAVIAATAATTAMDKALHIGTSMRKTGFQNDNDATSNNNHFPVHDFEYLDWLRAIPIGFLGGLVATLTAALYLKWDWSRIKGCQYLARCGCGGPVARQIFVVLAGLVFGSLGILWPYPVLFDNGPDAWQQILEARSNGVSAFELLHFGMHVMIGLAVCLGCGLVGGPVFPMLTIGATLGTGISCTFFPLGMSLPCGMAACLGGLFPAPLTIAFSIAMVFGLDTNQSITVFVATMTASTVGGGMGFVRRLGVYIWNLGPLETTASAPTTPNPYSYDDEEFNTEDEANLRRAPPDYEFLQGVQRTIFGSGGDRG